MTHFYNKKTPKSEGKFHHYKKTEKNFFCSKQYKNHLKMIFKQKKKFFFWEKIFFLDFDFFRKNAIFGSFLGHFEGKFG